MQIVPYYMENEMEAGSIAKLFEIAVGLHFFISVSLFILGYFDYIPSSWATKVFGVGLVLLILFGFVVVVYVIRDKKDVSSMDDIEGHDKVKDSHSDEGIVTNLGDEISERGEDDEDESEE